MNVFFIKPQNPHIYYWFYSLYSHVDLLIAVCFACRLHKLFHWRLGIVRVLQMKAS